LFHQHTNPQTQNQKGRLTTLDRPRDLPARASRIDPRRAFWSVAAAYAGITGFCAVPTPLYGLYAARDGFGSLTITIVFAVYAPGVILALFTVGHLSDSYGRRRVMLLRCFSPR